MKPGDMVLNRYGETAILLTDPRLVDEDEFFDPHYVAEVYLTEFNCKDIWATDDLEVFSEAQNPS